jgi:hypothetical protein
MGEQKKRKSCILLRNDKSCSKRGATGERRTERIFRRCSLSYFTNRGLLQMPERRDLHGGRWPLKLYIFIKWSYDINFDAPDAIFDILYLLRDVEAENLEIRNVKRFGNKPQLEQNTVKWSHISRRLDQTTHEGDGQYCTLDWSLIFKWSA